jgi:hypothetical protein
MCLYWFIPQMLLVSISLYNLSKPTPGYIDILYKAIIKIRTNIWLYVLNLICLMLPYFEHKVRFLLDQNALLIVMVYHLKTKVYGQTGRSTRTYHTVSEPTSHYSYSLLLYAKWGNCKYKYHSLWSDPTRARAYYAVSEPTSQCSCSLLLHTKLKNCKYEFHSLLFHPTGGQIHDLPHWRLERSKPLQHRSDYMHTIRNTQTFFIAVAPHLIQVLPLSIWTPIPWIRLLLLVLH